MRNYYKVAWDIFGMIVGIFSIFWSAFGIHQMLTYHWNSYLIIPSAIVCLIFGILGFGTSFHRLLKQYPNSSVFDFFIQIGIAVVMACLFAITIMAIIVVWICILGYSAVRWVIHYDGFSHNKSEYTNMTKLYKPIDPKLEEEFEKVFAKKPFPQPYSPADNPLYQTQPSPEALARLKASLPPFDREKVFKAVDESSVRMSKMTRKERHNLRGEKGRFIKRNQVETPITRYGVKTSERFGNQ